MDANLCHEATHEGRTQLVEARPIASSHRQSNRVTDDLAKESNLRGSAFYRFRCQFVSREDQVSTWLVPDINVREPVGQC